MLEYGSASFGSASSTTPAKADALGALNSLFKCYDVRPLAPRSGPRPSPPTLGDVGTAWTTRRTRAQRRSEKILPDRAAADLDAGDFSVDGGTTGSRPSDDFTGSSSGVQGRISAEGRRREPTKEERAEMERVRAEFLDVDDLPEGMSVPASVPPPGLDLTADAAAGQRGPTRSRPFRRRRPRRRRRRRRRPRCARTRTRSRPTLTRRARPVRPRPPASTVACVSTRGQAQTRRACRRIDRGFRIFEREMDETSEALLSGGSPRVAAGRRTM